MNTTQIPASRIREILAALNAHEEQYDKHVQTGENLAWTGWNTFEDLAYGFAEYDGGATEARFRDDENGFVLTDGTVIEEDGGDPKHLRWTASRYDAEALLAWAMDQHGRLSERDESGRWS